MNEHLRERIIRKLESLSDERGYQVLDYVEFLESRYAEKTSTASAFTRFSEAVEDRLRAGKVSATTIAEAMGLMNRAAGVLNGALAAGKSMANDLVGAARSAADAAAAGQRPTTGQTPAQPSPNQPGATAAPGSDGAGAGGGGAADASSPAHDTKMPGSGEEKL
jgi:hypothetical protein